MLFIVAAVVWGAAPVTAGGSASPDPPCARGPGAASFDEARVAPSTSRGEEGPRQDLPVVGGADVVRARCLTCHGTDLIAQQRLSREGWSREVDRMAGWGAAVEAADRDRIVDYLAANFGVRRASAGVGGADPGAAVLQTRCVVCHDLRLIEQQRLDAEGWRREVDKMIGWGALVTDLEKETLVAHLVRRAGDRATGKQ